MKTLDRHIEITPGIAGGKPRVAGRRIRVQDIAQWHLRAGRSIEDIAAEHEVSHAQIHAALAYYFDHREEIDRAIEDSSQFVEKCKVATPSKLTEKLPREVAHDGNH